MERIAVFKVVMSFSRFAAYLRTAVLNGARSFDRLIYSSESRSRLRALARVINNASAQRYPASSHPSLLSSFARSPACAFETDPPRDASLPDRAAGSLSKGPGLNISSFNGPPENSARPSRPTRPSYVGEITSDSRITKAIFRYPRGAISRVPDARPWGLSAEIGDMLEMYFITRYLTYTFARK